tara:strand:- start:1249 stop:2013 length:765 start_codon:yes stop_codon:yes gene_type:complete
MSTQIIILAGGKGTRIKPVLGDTPKILAPVKNRPFLDWLMLWIESWKFNSEKRIILSTCIGHELIKKYSQKKDYPIKCEKENKPLGTFGAIANVAIKNNAENYLILNGDTIFKANFNEAYEKYLSHKKIKPLIFLKEIRNNERYGGYKLTPKGWIFSTKKTNHISLGAFFISRKTLISRWENSTKLEFNIDQINKNHLQELMVDNDCFGDKPAIAEILKKENPFLDIGIPASLVKAQKYIPEILESQSKIILKN